MNKRFDWIGIILIGVNSLLVLSLIIFLIYGLTPGYTGTIGDTFGGLFSPIIGIVSIIYIYKTFEAQREQLDAQNEQLQDQQKATKLAINSLYYTEVTRIIDDIKQRYSSLT